MELEADFVLDLGNKVNETHKHILKGHAKPTRKPIGGSVIVPSTFTAPVLCILQAKPATGRCWNILRVGVFGADTHTAVTDVTVDVFAGDLLDTSSLNFPDCILSGAAVPSVTSFSKEVEWCYSGQMLYALIYGTGLEAAQPYEVVARVAEYNTCDVEASYIP